MGNRIHVIQNIESLTVAYHTYLRTVISVPF